LILNQQTDIERSNHDVRSRHDPIPGGSVAPNEELNRFDRIIVCMDNDKAGQDAVDKIFPCVPKDKLFVMSLELKDPNEYLVQGKEREFVNCFYKASPYVPVGLKGSGSLISAIREHALIEKIPLPPFMHKVQKMMAGGIPLGVIVNLISSSGTGKSTIVDEIVYHWIFNSPYKLGILSLESDSGEYGTKLLSRHVGRKINLIENIDDKIEFLDSDFVREKEKELFIDEHGQDRFILLDDRDGNVDTIQDAVEKMIVQMDCKVIVCDPLQDIIACLPDDEQNKFMSWQKGLLKSHGVTFFNVNHTKKALTGGGAGSQGVDLVEEDSHGSSSIYKSAACNMLFGRNKEAEDPIVRNTTHMKVSKMRWTGNTSPFAGKYFYDNATHTLHDYDDWMTKHPELSEF
ncbi:MAG TPA: AAA family ATPase, partial [Bacteroidia bacterium]|nr:AAA family ATPase [Bacteroidia bacterium]